MSLSQPGELPTAALQKREYDHEVREKLKRAVERHRASNEKEHERLSLDQLRKAVKLAHPELSDERVENIVRHQMRQSPRQAVARNVGVTAQDLVREMRRASVKARRRCRA